MVGKEQFFRGHIFKRQTKKTLDQANPVKDTYYEIGGTGFWATQKNVRIWSVGVNIEDVNETVAVKLTVDGIQYTTCGTALNHSSNYHAYVHPSPIGGLIQVRLTTVASTRPVFLTEGGTVKVELAKLTEAGAGKLEGVVDWSILRRA